MHVRTLDGHRQLIRGRAAQEPIDVAQVLSVEQVEFIIVGGGVLRSVPPAPVAAFRHPEFLLRQAPRVGLDLGILRVLGEEIARFAQHIPGAIVLVGANPDVVIGVDPGARDDVRQRARLGQPQRLACRDGAQLRVGSHATVKRLQEFPPVAGVVFPGVFAVQDHRNHRRPLAGASSYRLNALVQIGGGDLGIHAGIGKPNQVGKLVVAEEEGNRLSTYREHVGAV